MKAKEWVAILQSFDPDEEIIATIYSRELFGDENLVAPDGSEYAQCPAGVWDAVAYSFEFRDYVLEHIYDDIRLSLQEEIDRQHEGGE